MLSHPNVGKNRDLHQWVRTLIQNDGRVVVPEIADYEVRRELMRANKTEGLGKLDALKLAILEYLPLTTRAMERAARFWADSRQRGLPTCRDAELDADAILAAQAGDSSRGSQRHHRYDECGRPGSVRFSEAVAGCPVAPLSGSHRTRAVLCDRPPLLPPRGLRTRTSSTIQARFQWSPVAQLVERSAVTMQPRRETGE